MKMHYMFLIYFLVVNRFAHAHTHIWTEMIFFSHINRSSILHIPPLRSSQSRCSPTMCWMILSKRCSYLTESAKLLDLFPEMTEYSGGYGTVLHYHHSLALREYPWF